MDTVTINETADLTRISPTVSLVFLTPGSNPRSHVAFILSCLLHPLRSDSSLVFSLSFVTLTLLKRLDSYPVECPSIWICPLFPHDSVEVMNLFFYQK